MIENSDRGITMNKQLAWTMLAAICGIAWYGGTTVAQLQTSTEALLQSSADTKTMIAAERQAAGELETRVRVLETTTTRQDARFDALSRSLEEVKLSQRETNELLRQIVATEKK